MPVLAARETASFSVLCERTIIASDVLATAPAKCFSVSKRMYSGGALPGNGEQLFMNRASSPSARRNARIPAKASCEACAFSNPLPPKNERADIPETPHLDPTGDIFKRDLEKGRIALDFVRRVEPALVNERVQPNMILRDHGENLAAWEATSDPQSSLPGPRSGPAIRGPAPLSGGGEHSLGYRFCFTVALWRSAS